MVKVKDILAGKGREIFSIAPEEPVLAAVQQMADKGVGALLVMRAGELAGIVSERDYARKVVLRGRSSAETAVWEIMTSPVTTVGPEDTVPTCMMVMTEGKFRHLPVVANGRVLGVLSIGDLVKAVIEEQQREIVELKRYIAG